MKAFFRDTTYALSSFCVMTVFELLPMLKHLDGVVGSISDFCFTGLGSVPSMDRQLIAHTVVHLSSGW